jgi:hypothetical protein
MSRIIKVVEWQEQVTESGIQLAQNTTVSKKGELLSSSAFPAMDAAGRQGLIAVLTVRSFENNRIFGIPAEVCKFVGYFNLTNQSYTDMYDNKFVNRGPEQPESNVVEPLHKSETTSES